MSITEFSRNYVALGYPHNSALMNRVFVTDVSTSTLVWEQNNFLVEMYLMHPYAKVVKHTHPFENVSIHYSGKLLGSREGGIGRWLTDSDRGYISNILIPGNWHSFIVGDTGAIFYNVSTWNIPGEKTSATIRYIGEPLGPVHKNILQVNQ